MAPKNVSHVKAMRVPSVHQNLFTCSQDGTLYWSLTLRLNRGTPAPLSRPPAQLSPSCLLKPHICNCASFCPPKAPTHRREKLEVPDLCGFTTRTLGQHSNSHKHINMGTQTTPSADSMTHLRLSVALSFQEFLKSLCAVELCDFHLLN